MYDNFAAAIPDPVTILGVRLLPLSLGRYRLLHRFGCSFVAEGESVATIQDLVLGILVCSMPCQEFLDALNFDRRGLERQLKRWGKRIRREINHDSHFSIFDKYAIFKSYILEASRIPAYWDENGSNVGSAAHWSTAVEVVLRSNLGYSQAEVEEAPLSKCLLDYFKWAENQGSIRLMAPEELDQAEANAKIFEKLLKDHPELSPKEAN